MPDHWYHRLESLPIISALWQFLTCLISYLLATLVYHHVDPLWPYISDTGTLPPESCIFGQMLNITAFLVLLVVLIRFRVVKILLPGPKLQTLNYWSTIFGIISCLGMSIVANFPETVLLEVHLVGANMCFLSGTIYFTIHAYISWFMEETKKSIKYLRIGLCFFLFTLVPCVCITYNMAFVYFRERHGTNILDKEQFGKGYSFKVISAAAEWINMLAMNVYLISYIHEFKLVRCKEIVFETIR